MSDKPNLTPLLKMSMWNDLKDFTELLYKRFKDQYPLDSLVMRKHPTGKGWEEVVIIGYNDLKFEVLTKVALHDGQHPDFVEPAYWASILNIVPHDVLDKALWEEEAEYVANMQYHDGAIYMMRAIMQDNGMINAVEPEPELKQHFIDSISTRFEVFSKCYDSVFMTKISEEEMDMIATGDSDQVEELYGRVGGFNQLRMALDEFFEDLPDLG